MPLLRATSQTWRVLLWVGVHLWSRVCLPLVLWLSGSPRNQKVTLSVRARPATASAHRLARDILLVVVRERAKHLAFVRRMAPSVEPEDVLQLALLRAARHLDDVREGDRLEAWFWRILRNTIADENERLAREHLLLTQVRQGLDEISPQEVASCA